MTDQEPVVSRSHPLRDWLARHLRLGESEKFEVYLSVASSSALRDATYWAEILFSAGIATLGLTLGSPAVIIGAMLISPLMGPIMAQGLGLAAGDFILTFRATVGVLLSSLTAIVFSTFLVVLLPFREMTAEIAARTQPNTLDLFVALFSGAVGAIAVCKSIRGVATSIPGVAIAVALMPPLCVTGYGVGVLITLDRAQGLAIVRGGGLLFITNLVAITFASMLVFLLLHIDAEPVRARIREWRKNDPAAAQLHARLSNVVPSEVARIGSLPARLALAMALVVVVFVPLKRSFDALSAEIGQRQQLNRVQKTATSLWEEMFGRGARGDARSYIDRLDAEARDEKLALTIRTFISRSVEIEERQEYLERLALGLQRKPESIELAIIEIPTSKFQLEQAKKEIAAATPPEPLGVRLARATREAIAEISRTELPPGASLVDTALIARAGDPHVELTYLGAASISEDARALIAARVRERLGMPAVTVGLQWIPQRVDAVFDRRAETPGVDAETALRNLGGLVAGRPELSVLLQTAADDERAARRASAIRTLLRDAGVAEERIRIELLAGVPEDQVTALVARAPA